MKKTVLLCLVFLGLQVQTFAQEIDNYKYVVVPNKFDFLKEPNQYQVNALTRFLFEKFGFKTYAEGKEPENFVQHRCDALFANVEENSGIFVTRLKVSLKNCQNQTVFVSREGTSREKDFKTAYHEALRDAFQSINELDYKYNPVASSDPEPEKKVIAKAQISKPSKEEVEVKAETPEENKIEKPVEKPKMVKSEPAKEVVPAENMFSNNNSSYYLRSEGDGYKLYQKGMHEPFAALVASQKDGQFIYSSFTGQGVAYFDDKGNLVVETLDKSNNSTNTKVYQLEKRQ